MKIADEASSTKQEFTKSQRVWIGVNHAIIPVSAAVIFSVYATSVVDAFFSTWNIHPIAVAIAAATSLFCVFEAAETFYLRGIEKKEAKARECEPVEQRLTRGRRILAGMIRAFIPIIAMAALGCYMNAVVEAFFSTWRYYHSVAITATCVLSIALTCKTAGFFYRRGIAKKEAKLRRKEAKAAH